MDNEKFLEIPLDYKYFIQNKRNLKKELSEKSFLLEKRIAILGGSTFDEFINQLEVFLLFYGVKPIFYKSQYGKYWEEAVFDNKGLQEFKPDLILIYTSWRNINVFPNVDDSADIVNEKLAIEFDHFKTMWLSLKERYKCTIIQNNFDRPNYRLFGNRDTWDYRGRTNYIFRLNQLLYEFASSTNDFFINDIDYVSSVFGLDKWNSELYWCSYKYFCDLNAIPLIAKNASLIIKSLYGYNKKILSIDLDNTLWGGVIGEEGVRGIKIGPDFPEDEVFYNFQKYCKNLSNIGVLLSINSKNNYQDALDGLAHPNSVLKEGDFVSIKANWNQKSDNIVSLANELSLGQQSFVFIDDNPAERENVKMNCEFVSVPNIKSPEHYISIIDSLGYFEITHFSKEDLSKTKNYISRSKAIASMSYFNNYDDYLRSLSMRGNIRFFDEQHLDRIVQLINKSNQFNLTTTRLSETQVMNIVNSKDRFGFYAELKDKFADYGLVGIAICTIKNDSLFIDNLLMSCRVLKRGLEFALLNHIFEFALQNKCKTIYGKFIKSAKNHLVEHFYEDAGFLETNVDGDEKNYCLCVLDHKDFGHFIDLKE